MKSLVLPVENVTFAIDCIYSWRYEDMAPSASFLQSKEQHPNLAATTITGTVQVRLHLCPAQLHAIRLRFHQTGTCRMYNLQ